MRFSVLNLLALIAAVALAVTLDIHEPILSFFILIAFPLIAIGACLHLIYRVRMYAANQLAPLFYSRGILSLLRWTCGKEYSAWALCNYGARLAENKQHNLAIVVYTRVLDLEPSSSEYWAHRGSANYKAGNLAAADRDLTQAIILDQGNKIALAHRGYTRLSLGNYREAIDDLERVHCEGSEDSTVALYRGHGYEQLCQWLDAIDDYLLAHDLDPSQTIPAISVARIQAGCPVDNIRNGEKAVDNAYTMCVCSDWKDWIAITVLAAAHAEVGRFDKAIEFANLAIELAPTDEKPERLRRLEQYRADRPFRISGSDHQSTLPVEINATKTG